MLPAQRGTSARASDGQRPTRRAPRPGVLPQRALRPPSLEYKDPTALGDHAGAYLDAEGPIVLLGDSGTGKSHLLIGLWPPANKDAEFATPQSLNSSTSSSRRPTSDASAASWPLRALGPALH